MTGIDRLAASWADLSAIAATSYVQLEAWHRARITALATGPEDMLFAAVYQEADCIAIVPLVRETLSIAGLPLRALSLPLHDHLPHADLLVRPGFTSKLSLSWLADALAEQQPAFDALVLDSVLEDAAAADLLRAEPPKLSVSEPIGISDALPTSGYDGRLQGLSRNFRGNLRKARNKITDLGEAARATFAHTPDDLGPAFQSFLAVEASGWKGGAGSGTAIALEPRLRAFYGQLVERLGPTGACGINLLWLHEKPIAAQLSITVGARCFLLKIGYDEAHSHLAPGNLLLEKLLLRLDQHPRIAYVDLVSDAPWHASWKPEIRQVFRHLVFRPTPRGLLGYAAWKSKPSVRLIRAELQSRWKDAAAAFKTFPWIGS